MSVLRYIFSNEIKLNFVYDFVASEIQNKSQKTDVRTIINKRNLSKYNAVNSANSEMIILSVIKLLLLEFLNHSKMLSPVINERNATNI